MKIVIDIEDIPKNDHERYALSKGTPLEKVFKDIKAEIKGEMKNPVELAKNRALYWVLEIIDKHISIGGDK